MPLFNERNSRELQWMDAYVSEVTKPEQRGLPKNLCNSENQNFEYLGRKTKK